MIMSKMACFRGIGLPAFIMLMIIGMANGRWLELEPYLVSSSSSLISDGSDGMSYENPGPNLADEKRCQSIYGFLPCADTMQEGVFLMIMYTYLMMLGEEWIHEGSGALFLLLGDQAIGASVFRVLMALPRIVIVIVSGVLSTASAAQNQVAFGVSMYAGSTVITLTLIWGFRVILSRDKLRGKGLTSESECEHQEDPSSTTSSSFKQKLSILKDTGVNIDKETGDMAVIMLLSLIPFATVELVALIKSSPVTLLFALIVSALSLVLYLAYQVGNPLIQARSLAYLKQENLRARFLSHVKRLANDDLIDHQGNPKSETFKRFFDEADEDNDECISQLELEKLIVKQFKLEKDHISTEYAKAEILTHFDKDKSGKINWLEFEKGCTKWLKNVVNTSGRSSSKNIWKHIAQTAIENKRANITQIELIMPRILQQVLEKHQLVKEDGEPNREKIEGLFSEYDKDSDNEIHRDELKQFIETLQFGVSLDHNTVMDELVKDFDNDSNRTIDKNEFVEGFIKWIRKATSHDPTIKDPKRAIQKFEEDSWREIDAPMNMVKPRASILYVISGIGIMYLISGAFMQSVIQFSDAAHIPFLLTSFVMAPLAMNARSIIKASLSARPHVMKNASLTFSEIYSGLVMNNLLGLTTLLGIVCIKGLSWNYSNEVLTIMLPCAIIGLFVLKRDTYPLWASISAMLLYPISICLYYVLYH